MAQEAKDKLQGEGLKRVWARRLRTPSVAPMAHRLHRAGSTLARKTAFRASSRSSSPSRTTSRSSRERSCGGGSGVSSSQSSSPT